MFQIHTFVKFSQELNMLSDYFILIIVYIGGTFTGILTVKFFSNEIIHKLETSFENQLNISIEFYNKSLQFQTKSLNDKLNYQSRISDNFKLINDYLSNTASTLNQLNKDCNTRKELESEIIKLKKILKRMEIK